MNLAPVADVSDKNSFMASRSFSNDYLIAGRCVETSVKYMKQEGLITCLKHFPGYGNATDTHNGTYVDKRTADELKEDINVFAKGIDAGAATVMVSHITVEAIDKNNPASLSEKVINSIRNLGFDGVIITDDLGMGALAGEDDVYVRAVNAGNDVLEVTNYEEAKNAIMDAINADKIKVKRINEAVTRILTLKFEYGIINEEDFQASVSSAVGNSNVCDLAISQIGKPYVVGAEQPEVGFDCSGLVVWVYQEAGYDWGGTRLTANGFSQIGREISRDQLKPGDLICTGWNGSKYGHIIIYIGNNEVVGAEAVCSLPWDQHTSGACTSGCCVRRRQMTDDELNGTTNKYFTLDDYYTGTGKVQTNENFVTNFLNAAKEVTDYVKENNFLYGHANYMPPREDGTTNNDGSKHISCDRLVSWALYKCGYTDQPEHGLCTTSVSSPLMDYCKEKGWQRIDDVNDVQAGDIVFSGSTNASKTTASHTFICAGENLRYDCGSVERIRLTDKYSSYSSQPFNEPITNFVCAYRVTTGYSGSYEVSVDSAEVDNFQGTIKLRRVTPNKSVGVLKDVSTGATTEKGTYVEASSVGLGTKEDIPESLKEKMDGISMNGLSGTSYDELSYLTIPYYDFNGKVQKGHMVVNKELADEVLLIFQELYNIQYPIERMDTVEELYDEMNEVDFGDDANKDAGTKLDITSMWHNNTSAFNDRNTSSGSSSNHALGCAIDINPLINPYVTSNYYSPLNAEKYTDRSMSGWTNKEKDAVISKDSKIYEIFTKYGWTWGGDWDDTKDYQHFEKTDLTNVAHILSISVEDEEDDEEDDEEEKGKVISTSSGNTQNNAGINSKIYDLKYVSKELFEQHVEDGNKQALNEFTIDEDDGNKIIVATWSVTNGETKLTTKKFQASDTYTEKYTMPIEYLLAYYIDTRNKEFVIDLADLAMNSEFILAIQDNVTTTKTEVFKSVNVKTYKGPSRIFVSDETGETTLESSNLTENVSTSIDLTYGDTWFVKFYKDINYSSSDLNRSGRINTVQTIDGNVQISEVSKETSEEKYKTVDDDGHSYFIVTTTTTTTVDNTISYKYNTGEMHVIGNEQKFITIYKKNQDFRTLLKPEWLFKVLEQQEKTANMVDLTKYLIYLARGQKYDYGVTKYDFSEYEPEDFSKISIGVFGSDILLDYLKSWENPTVWYYQTDKIGYSSYVAKYITEDKTKYICFDDGLSTRNFGFGVCHYYSGHFNNQDVYASVGIDITQYFNIGSLLDVEIVDKVKLMIVENNRKVITSNLEKAGISLEEYQLQALDAICYQWGPYGTINDFIKAYQQYGDTEALRQNFTHHGDKPFLTGDNARAYEIKRANANWTLFHEGRYLTSDGGELDPSDYTSVNVGEIASISLDQRMSYVFPSGTPNSASEMGQYLTTITVPINNSSGVPTTTQITCHKAIADELVAIFTEMQAVGFRITDAYSYSWRSMASGTGSRSHHSYGLAIDINASANPAAYWGYKPDPTSPYYINEQIVNIWKAHGFYWGGDWSPSYYDPMHFSYTNH